MELTYRKCGDYYIPDIALNDTEDYQIGRYGRMRLRYLKEHHPGVYSHMLLSETLWNHLAEIDATCNERLDNLIPAMTAREGVTEALKASDQMEWVSRMNSIRHRAEEMVLDEMVYTRCGQELLPVLLHPSATGRVLPQHGYPRHRPAGGIGLH